MTVERQVRLSQTVVPFGVGAVYDYRGESLVACDISFWKGRGRKIDLPRLASALGVGDLKAAPSVVGFERPDNVWRVPFVRFPSWLFCGTCRRMTKWSGDDEQTDEQPRCDRCRRRPQLIPMRFVVACDSGHLGDVYWDRWAHSRAKEQEQKQCHSKDLQLKTSAGGGIGLETLRVVCRTCNAARTLQGITSAEVTKAAGITCPGRQPWQRIADRVACESTPRVVQRGASNLYFARIESALDIPPHSAYDPYAEDVIEITNTNEFGVIRTSPNGPIADRLVGVLAERFQTTGERIRSILASELAEESGRPVQTGEVDLAAEEWSALLHPVAEHDHRDSFITRETTLIGDTDQAPPASVTQLTDLIDRVILATRLREVRALVGFSRYRPDADLVRSDLGRGIDFLPAVEVHGEGIFLTFDEDGLARWEQEPEVVQRVEMLERRRGRSFLGERLPRATPRLVLLHSFAHILIRQLAFESGYPAASLRERIYARAPELDGGPQAGVLVYTAAGDIEGTLGGLVRMGEPPHLTTSILSALEAAAWCSTDPICAESLGQGFGAMNLAACHACSLLAETSCVHSNLLLDRGLLVGTPQFRAGFFIETIDSALKAAEEAGA